MDPGSLLDLDRYPVVGDDPVWLGEHRHRFETDGVLVLPGFVSSGAVAAFAAEADALTPGSHHQDVAGTPYLGLPDESFPPGHPRRHESRSALTAVAYDQFAAGSLLRALYEWDPLMAFIGRLLGETALYRYADPLGALNVAVMAEGDELGWHFDQTDLVVSIALRASAAGGDFENAAHLRSHADEAYDTVAAVLDGSASHRVRTEPMTPGTLMLFRGRHSLHRVTRIEGPTTRLVALLAYDTEPGTDSTDLLKLVRYGRLPQPA